MAPIKITGVVSCSTEDKTSCAKNLLLSDSFKKWSTEKPGLPSASVILKLESEQLITGIDIGNNGSAFVEVLVANSANDSEFVNLLVMSAFMTPSESRNQTNKFKIRMFGRDELCKQAIDKKWDRVKIVCTQPYNKNSTYGLSVVTVQGLNKPISNTPLKVMDPVASKPMVTGGSSEVSKSPHVKRQRVLETGPSKEGKAASNLLSKLEQNKAANSKEALDRLKETGDKGFNRISGHSKVLDIRDDEEDNKPSTSNKNNSNKSTNSSTNRDISLLLTDVVFVLSGFQNPLRSDIREIGVSLGAKYRPDWCLEATHLICAIPNTPKFNQVKGKGIIVGKEWLFDCKKERRRLSETNYMLDKPKPSQLSSDEEPSGKSPAKRKHTKKIEYAESSDSEEDGFRSKRRKTAESEEEEFVPSQTISSSDSDEGEKESLEPVESVDIAANSEKSRTAILEISSDDEDVPLINPVSKPKLPDISDSESETEHANIYEAETDEESEESVIERLGLPPLPNFFSGHRFFIHADSFEDVEDMRQLHRYLVAYGGKVFEHMSPEVSFIVTKSQSWLSDFKQALVVNAQVKFLQCSWVEASSKQLKAVPKNSYYIYQ